MLSMIMHSIMYREPLVNKTLFTIHTIINAAVGLQTKKLRGK